MFDGQNFVSEMDFHQVCQRCLHISSHLRRTISASARLTARPRNENYDVELHTPPRASTRNKMDNQFWEDTRQVFGQHLENAKAPPYENVIFDPAKGKLPYKEWRQMTTTAQRTFNEQTALLYGPRLSQVPDSVDVSHSTLPHGYHDPVEFVIKDAGYVDDDGLVPNAQDPTGSMEALAEAVGKDDVVPSPPVEIAVEIQKPKPVRYVKEDDEKVHWTKVEPYYDEKKMPDYRKQKWTGHTPFLEYAAVTEPKKKFGTLESSKDKNVESVPSADIGQKPKSSFRVVILKKETDLKSLAQAPMLNKLRPDYEDAPDGLTLPTPMVLQISPVDLMAVDLSPEQYPAVTTILDVTMPPESRQRLDKWEKAKIEQLGLDGFRNYKQALFTDGKGFHTAVEQVLHGASPKSVRVPTANEGHWQSLQDVFKDISDVVGIEEKVTHPYLCYKGQTDCVISLSGEPAVVEWKTSERRKDTADALFDYPLQVAAYVGAVNFDKCFEEKNTQVRNGAVVVAYANGDPASVILFDANLMRKYWSLWLRRVQQYWRLAAAEKFLPRRRRDVDAEEV